MALPIAAGVYSPLLAREPADAARSARVFTLSPINKRRLDNFRRNTRGIDLACRLGGEEFVIIMPDTDLARAIQVGERLRATIAADPFPIPGNKELRVTASVGISTLENRDDTPETLAERVLTLEHELYPRCLAELARRTSD